jgi:hypothetical protein
VTSLPTTRQIFRTSAVLQRFLVRRQRWTLTWTGGLLTLTVAVVLVLMLARGLSAFLAVSSPIGGQFLVVEGWMPTYVYREAAAQFRKGGYGRVIAVRVTRDDAGIESDLPEHSGAEKMIDFGVPSDLVSTAASEEVYRDRTFHAATAVKLWLQQQGFRDASVDLVTLGPHARRSRLLYEKALGDGVRVGVISIEDRRFDPDHWWRSSNGVRTVVDELIAYLYARIVFSPPH